MKKILFSLTFIMACLLAAPNAMAEIIKTPEMQGAIDDVPALMQLTFNSDNNQVTGWYYYYDAGKQSKRELKGTYEGELLSCTVELKEVKLDKESLTFTGDYMSGTMVNGISGTATLPDGTELEFSFDY
jgi:hypothetical protein